MSVPFSCPFSVELCDTTKVLFFIAGQRRLTNSKRSMSEGGILPLLQWLHGQMNIGVPPGRAMPGQFRPGRYTEPWIAACWRRHLWLQYQCDIYKQTVNSSCCHILIIFARHIISTMKGLFMQPSNCLKGCYLQITRLLKMVRIAKECDRKHCYGVSYHVLCAR